MLMYHNKIVKIIFSSSPQSYLKIPLLTYSGEAFMMVFKETGGGQQGGRRLGGDRGRNVADSWTDSVV